MILFSFFRLRAVTNDRRGSGGIALFDQDQITTGALHKRAHRRGIVLAFDQIAFPVTGHLPVFNLGRTHVNAHHIGNLAAPVNTAAARSAGAFALAQTHDQLLTQLAHGQGVDGVVDRFPANVGFFKIHFHSAQLARDLLGRKALSKQVDNQLEQLIARHQLSGGTTGFSTFASKGLGPTGRIASGGDVISSQLAADGGRTTPKQTSNRSLTEALVLSDLNGYAFFDAEFGIRHRRTLPEVEVLHSVFAAADHLPKIFMIL